MLVPEGQAAASAILMACTIPSGHGDIEDLAAAEVHGPTTARVCVDVCVDVTTKGSTDD